MAKVAVQSFLGQTYPNRHLLIVNDGPAPVYTAPPARVIEMRLHPGGGLGQLRNLALEAIQRDSQVFGRVHYVTQWNDDDWSHPMRIAYQMDNIKPGGALLLQNEINCHLRTGAAFANSGNSIRGGGFPGMIIHPWTRPTATPINQGPRARTS